MCITYIYIYIYILHVYVCLVRTRDIGHLEYMSCHSAIYVPCPRCIASHSNAIVWYGMVWYGMVWYGMVWYGLVWYGMVWFCMCHVIDRYVISLEIMP